MKKVLNLTILLSCILFCYACGGDSTTDDDAPGQPPIDTDIDFVEDSDNIYIDDSCGQKATQYPLLPEFEGLGLGPNADGETLLDFSRVGYQWGDKPLPSIPVVKTISAPTDGSDACALLQGAIDEVAALPYSQRGAILLKAGLYNLKEPINIHTSGIVLRGEGTDEQTGTRLISTRTDNGFDNASTSILLNVKGESGRHYTLPSTMNIIEDVPAGQFWARVSNATSFSVGDQVIVHAETPMALISDLKMDQIPARPNYDPASYRWNENTINNKNMERVVTKIKGDTLWFENPISMSMLEKYNRGAVVHYTARRISECGVEDMFLGCVYNANDPTDENHCYQGILIDNAEHCWVKNVHGKYFVFGLVDLRSLSKNITVTDCVCTDNKSTLGGSRGYPFIIWGQLALIKDCYAEDGNKSFSSSRSTTNGPNVFLRCKDKDTHSDVGPHRHWATGTLYDNYKGTSKMKFIDRDDLGPGHGWTETNGVFWNCETTDEVYVQSPWVLGKNYAVGVIGKKGVPYRPDRPDGVWISHGTHVQPESLYEAQLAQRRRLQPGGVFDVH